MASVIIPYNPRRLQLLCHKAIDRSRFSVVVAHRGFGKTILSINHTIRKAATGPKEGVYGYIAPFRQQAKAIAWDYLKRYTKPIPGVTPNEAELSVRLPNGAKIGIYGADNPDSLRGIHWDGIVPDEVAQMKANVWGEILRPGLTARQGWALFIGTPKGQNLFHELAQYAMKTKDWFYGFFPVTETDIYSAEEIQLAKDSMTESQYAQEYLCDFSAASEDILIPLHLAQAASVRKYSNNDFVNAAKIMAVDIARFGDDGTVITKRQGVATWPQIKMRGQQNETVALAGRIANEIKTWEPDGVFIDAGYNPGVIDTLRSWGYTISSVDFGGSASDPYYLNKRAEMWCLMRDWLQAGGAIPDDAELKGDLITPTYDFGGRGGALRLESKEDIKERLMRSPDKGDSLALTFAAPVVKQIPMTKQYQAKHNDVAPEYDPFEALEV